MQFSEFGQICALYLDYAPCFAKLLGTRERRQGNHQYKAWVEDHFEGIMFGEELPLWECNSTVEDSPHITYTIWYHVAGGDQQKGASCRTLAGRQTVSHALEQLHENVRGVVIDYVVARHQSGPATSATSKVTLVLFTKIPDSYRHRIRPR